MTDVTFTVEQASMTVEVGSYGFSSGFVVIRHEPGQLDTFASKLFQTREDAEKKAELFRARAAKKAAAHVEALQD